MKAIIIPLILFCNFCFGQKEYNDDSCRAVKWEGSLTNNKPLDEWFRIDTIPSILLFIETSKKNTTRSCRWINGYEVRVSSFPSSTSFYLDYRKRRLPKNVIVFMSIN